MHITHPQNYQGRTRPVTRNLPQRAGPVRRLPPIHSLTCLHIGVLRIIFLYCIISIYPLPVAHSVDLVYTNREFAL
jgi:hypothetical protein